MRTALGRVAALDDNELLLSEATRAVEFKNKVKELLSKYVDVGLPDVWFTTWIEKILAENDYQTLIRNYREEHDALMAENNRLDKRLEDLTAQLAEAQNNVAGLEQEKKSYIARISPSLNDLRIALKGNNGRQECWLDMHSSDLMAHAAELIVRQASELIESKRGSDHHPSESEKEEYGARLKMPLQLLRDALAVHHKTIQSFLDMHSSEIMEYAAELIEEQAKEISSLEKSNREFYDLSNDEIGSLRSVMGLYHHEVEKDWSDTPVQKLLTEAIQLIVKQSNKLSDIERDKKPVSQYGHSGKKSNATVRVMRSHDYCHFESTLSSVEPLDFEGQCRLKQDAEIQVDAMVDNYIDKKIEREKKAVKDRRIKYLTERFNELKGKTSDQLNEGDLIDLREYRSIVDRHDDDAMPF